MTALLELKTFVAAIRQATAGGGAEGHLPARGSGRDGGDCRRRAPVNRR
jgi:hypothetical protein